MARQTWLVLVLVAGCPVAVHGQDEKGTNTDLSPLPRLAHAAAIWNEMFLYKGLPHQRDRELVEQERRTKKTLELDGYPFYQEQLTLNGEDAAKLGELLADKTSFEKWRGGKFCGGFHPDYCIEWRVGTDVYRAHICLGCHEVKFFGEGTELYCDIRKEAYDRFAAILKKYRKNRPDPQTP